MACCFYLRGKCRFGDDGEGCKYPHENDGWCASEHSCSVGWFCKFIADHPFPPKNDERALALCVSKESTKHRCCGCNAELRARGIPPDAGWFAWSCENCGMDLAVLSKQVIPRLTGRRGVPKKKRISHATSNYREFDCSLCDSREGFHQDGDGHQWSECENCEHWILVADAEKPDLLPTPQHLIPKPVVEKPLAEQLEESRAAMKAMEAKHATEVATLKSQHQTAIDVLKERVTSEEKLTAAANLRAEKTQGANPLVQEQQKIFERLYGVACEFARGNGKPIPLPNPVVATSRGSVLFIKGLVRLGYGGIRDLLDKPSHYSVGFHGTKSKEAICSIFQDGFDPTLRQFQRYGTGEYFDIGKGQVADLYGAGTNCLIVAVIVKRYQNGEPLDEYSETVGDVQSANKGAPSTRGEYAIINNPLPTNGPRTLPPYTFAVPCAVVSDKALRSDVEQAVYEQFKDGFKAMGRAVPTTPPAPAPPRTSGTLCFKDQNGQWSKQEDRVQKYVRENPSSKVFNFNRDVGNGQHFSYTVDLNKMIQTNLDTKVVRALKWT